MQHTGFHRIPARVLVIVQRSVAPDLELTALSHIADALLTSLSTYGWHIVQPDAETKQYRRRLRHILGEALIDPTAVDSTVEAIIALQTRAPNRAVEEAIASVQAHDEESA